MSSDIKTNILWLSDIHIWNKYKEKYDTELESFFQSIFSAIKDQEKLDYILLTGDIAYAGDKNDYEYFENLFFSKLSMSKHKNVKILVVPGNHDINHSSSKNLIDTISYDGREVYKKRSEYLTQENESAYLKNFKDYIGFFSSSKIKKYFPASGSNQSYQDHKLFGYHLDSSKKIIFILINSAWFSLGGNFRKLMKAKFMETPEIADFEDGKFSIGILEKKIEELLRIKDNIAEYGTQVIGSRLLEDLNLIQTLLHKYSDFTTLTIMHHPPNWLHWEEKYNHEPKKQASNTLHGILNCSNFLLTGHDHVPQTKNKVLYDNQLCHLQAGCVLDELKNGTDFIKLTHNRFSILEIHNGTNNWLIETIFKYHPYKIKNQLVHSWTSNEIKEPIFYSYKYAAAPNDITTSEFNLLNHLAKQNKGAKIKSPIPIKTTFDYSIFKSNDTVYIISKTCNSIKKILNIKFVNKLLFDLKGVKVSKNTIYFILKDTHCKSNVYNKLPKIDYNEIRIQREKLFEIFYNEYNFKFDVFRNSFFKFLEKNKKFDCKTIMNINIICEILPYWYFENNSN